MEMMQLKTHGPGLLGSEWVVTSVADLFYQITGLLPQLTAAKKLVEFSLNSNICLSYTGWIKKFQILMIQA